MTRSLHGGARSAWCGVKALLGVGVLALLGACAGPPSAPAGIKAGLGAPLAAGEFDCGGAVEAATWRLWNAQGRAFLRDQLIGSRLQAQGDTYALYDMQVYFQNLSAMAQRCQRLDRLVQMAGDLLPVFDQLEPLPGQPGALGWVCKGGAVCNARNKLVNTEVMLVSLQGLGWFSALAQALANADDPAARTHPFVARAAQATAVQLQRWGDDRARTDWRRAAHATPADVKDGSSALFFSDKPLWMIALHANLAGTLAAQPGLLATLTRDDRAKLAGGMRDLLAFFKARTTLLPASGPWVGRALAADIDRGFWRLHADSRFAGYAGAAPPALCDGPAGAAKARLQIDPDKVPVVPTLGWDFSHARRLVPVLQALQGNAQALQQVYGLAPAALPPPDLARDFAAQLVAHVWNGDTAAPLFSNYWDGTNGWYRVAYDVGIGRCQPGYPPYGLSDSFTTGGYAVWASHDAVIGDLARTLYRQSQAGTPQETAFIRQHYSGLLTPSVNNRMVTQLMFWPTLVGRD